MKRNQEIKIDDISKVSKFSSLTIWHRLCTLSM